MQLQEVTRRLVLAVVLLVASAFPLLAQPSSPCQKDVFVYVDVSKTMRTKHNGKSQLQVFMPAIRALLTNTSDFLQSGDRIRVLPFSLRALRADLYDVDRQSLEQLRRALNELENLPVVKNDTDSDRTDLRVPFNDLVGELTAENRPTDRKMYVILASDLIHDPEEGLSTEARKEQFASYVDRELDELRSRKAQLRLILLDTTVAGESDTALRDEARKLRDALEPATLRAGSSTLLQDLKKVIARPITVSPTLQMDGNNAVFALQVANENAFPVTVTSIRNGQLRENTTIACGEARPIPATLQAGARVEVEFDTGQPVVINIPSQALEVNARSIRYLPALGKGTLLLHLNVNKTINQDTDIGLDIGSPPVNVKLPIRQGTSSEGLAVSIPVSPAAGERVRASATVNIDVSTPPGIDDLKGPVDSTRTSVSKTTVNTEGDWRNRLFLLIKWAWAYVLLAICARIPILRLRRAVEAGIHVGFFDFFEGKDVPVLLLCVAHGKIPPFPISFPDLTIFLSWIRAVPAALIVTIVVWYALRLLALYFWHLAIEPRGKDVIRAQDAQRKLDTLIAAIHAFVIFTFIVSIVAIESLVYYGPIVTPK